MDDITVLTACRNAKKLNRICALLGIQQEEDPVFPHELVELHPDADHFSRVGPTVHPHPDPYFWEKGFEEHEP